MRTYHVLYAKLLSNDVHKRVGWFNFECSFYYRLRVCVGVCQLSAESCQLSLDRYSMKYALCFVIVYSISIVLNVLHRIGFIS